MKGTCRVVEDNAGGGGRVANDNQFQNSGSWLLKGRELYRDENVENELCSGNLGCD